MLKLPKIDEEFSPLIKQYREAVLSKSTYTQNTHKSIPSKYDWMTCELHFASSISHEAILKSITNFQLICKNKNIAPFYSYFFLKSLFLNKNLTSKQKQNLQQGNEKESVIQNPNSSRPLTAQIQTYLIQKIEEEVKKIQAGSSSYQKIKNCISLRQELLEHFSDNSGAESQNVIHQNAYNIRYLNFELVGIIKTWKESLGQLQTIVFTGENLAIDSLSTIESIYVHEEQNYLCKIIYDNANVISTINSKKQGKFISPPNPFFLSQDGNKESMSQQEKHKIQEAMEFFAKEKAFELKILLQQPEYVSKKNDIRDILRSSSSTRIKAQKSSVYLRKDDPFKKLFGSLTKLQLPEKKYHPIKEVKVQNSGVKKEKYAPTGYQRGKTQNNEKILSVYQKRASKLKQQVFQSTETRDKFETMIKKSQLSMLKDLRKKKTPPKQVLPKFTVELKTFEQRLKESPYKQRVSSLRREVQKNVAGIKLTKNQIPVKVQKLDQSMLTYKNLNPIKRPFMEVKTTTPKIKLIEQKEVNIDKIPNPIIIPQKDEQKNTKEKSLSRSKGKEEKQKSYSTFFKTPEEEQMQRSMMKESRIRGSMVMQGSSVKQRIDTLKRKSPELDHYATTSNYYKRQKKNSVEVESNLNNKKKASQPNLTNQKSKNRTKQENARKDIDSSLKSLKQRLRSMEIIKAYGRKTSYPKKREMSEMSLSAINEDELVKENQKVSPKKKEHNEKKNRSTFMKKQAEMLEMKIEKLLQKQDKSFRFQKSNQRIHQMDEQHEYRTTNKFAQFNAERLSQTESIFDQNLNNLQKKQHLIHQSNQMKQKELEQTAKAKLKISQEVTERKQRLRQMEQKIAEMKQNRKASVGHSEQKMKQSVLNESRQLIVGQQATKVKHLKQTQSDMRKQNQDLHQQMIKEEQKFIKLKEEEYRMRQQLNRKKYQDQLHEVKSKYVQKQREYEQKILQEEKQRKQNEIRLMKQKRQTQELQMRLHEQEMKQLLLKEMMQKQQQRWQKQQQDADQYQQEVRKLISTELGQKEEKEREMNKIYMEENYKLIQLMNQMRQKNFKIQQANKLRLADVQKAIIQKQQEIKKLEQLERQVEKLQKSRNLSMENDQEENGNQDENMSVYTPLHQDDLEDLKLRLKEEILKEMIERRKREEQEDLKFEEQRKRRLKLLQNQIKDFLRKQGQISKVLQYAKPDEIRNINVKNILNREILHQQQKEIQTKSKSIEKFRNQVQSAEKDMITATTDHQTVYGQKASQKQLLDTSNNQKAQYPKSSLKNVLQSHQKQSPSNNQFNEAITNPVTHFHSELLLDSNVVNIVQKPLRNQDKVDVPNKERNQLSKIQDTDRSQSFVLSRQSPASQERRRNKQINKIQLVSNIFTVTNFVQEKPLRKSNSKHESSKEVQEQRKSNSRHESSKDLKKDARQTSKHQQKKLRQTPKHQQKQKNSQNQGEEISPVRGPSKRPPTQSKSSKNQPQNERFRKSSNRIYQKSPQKDQANSYQKYPQKSPQKSHSQSSQKEIHGESIKRNPRKTHQQSDEQRKSKLIDESQRDAQKEDNYVKINEEPRENRKQKSFEETRRVIEKSINDENPKKTHSSLIIHDVKGNEKTQQNLRQQKGRDEQNRQLRNKKANLKSPQKKSKQSSSDEDEQVHNKSSKKVSQVKQSFSSQARENLTKKPQKSSDQDSERDQKKKISKARDSNESQTYEKVKEKSYEKNHGDGSERTNNHLNETVTKPVDKSKKQIHYEEPTEQVRHQNSSKEKIKAQQSSRDYKNVQSSSKIHQNSKDYVKEKSIQKSYVDSKKYTSKESKQASYEETRNRRNQEGIKKEKAKERMEKGDIIMKEVSISKNDQSRNQVSKRVDKRKQISDEQIENDDHRPSRQVDEKEATKKEASKQLKSQIKRRQVEKQIQIQKSRSMQPANNSISKQFGQISQIQEQDQQSKQKIDTSKQQRLGQSNESVQKPNQAIQEPQTVRQRVFKSDQEMIQKFQALKEYLKLDAQFVTIQQAQIQQFLEKFYAAYPQEVQEMFSFTRSELLMILKNYKSMDRKIDLFDCHSIGWYDRANNKYILIGSLGCAHLVAQKYGEIQIQMAYLFDRGNHRQKKYLVKQIKVFEKVGSLFQKKLDEDNHYSLKLIIKITKEMIPAESHIPDQLVHFNSVVTLDSSGGVKSNKKVSPFQQNRLIFEHILADCMWQNMKKQQIEEYVKANSSQSIDLNVFVKSLQSFNEQDSSKQLKEYILNEEEMTSQIDLYFKLPYIQLGKKIHYQLQSEQYQLKNGQKAYLTKHINQNEDQQALWKFLVFQTSKTVLDDNFIETLLKAKLKQINKLKPERQLNLVLPLFKIKSSFTANQTTGLKQNFRHKSNIDGDLIVSSISCANSTVDGQRKVITLSKKSPEMGFVFCACYTPGDKIEKVVTGSWVGYSDLIR